jgi:hypothetical protein
MILLISLSVLCALSLVVNVLLYKNVKHYTDLINTLKATNLRTQDALHKINVQAEEFKMKIYSLNMDLKKALEQTKVQTDAVKPSQNGQSTQSGQPTTTKVATKKYYKKSPKKNPNPPSSSK